MSAIAKIQDALSCPTTCLRAGLGNFGNLGNMAYLGNLGNLSKLGNLQDALSNLLEFHPPDSPSVRMTRAQELQAVTPEELWKCWENGNYC